MSVPIVYRSTDLTKWGPGKDQKLTIAEGDGNWWELAKAIDALINDPPSAVSIANITVVGSQMQIQLTNGQTMGPFALPVAAFRYRKDGYNVGDTYNVLDLLPIDGLGLYMVLTKHVASGAFDPNGTDGSGNALFLLLFGEETYIYDFSFSYPGKPGNGLQVGDAIAEHLFLRDVYFPAGFSGSIAKLSTAPADGDLVYNIVKDDAVVGTLTFTLGNTTGVFGSAVTAQFGNGETLGLVMTAEPDSTARGLRVGFFGHRGVAA